MSKTEAEIPKTNGKANQIITNKGNDDNFFPRKRTHGELQKLSFDNLSFNNNYDSYNRDLKDKIFKFY